MLVVVDEVAVGVCAGGVFKHCFVDVWTLLARGLGELVEGRTVVGVGVEVVLVPLLGGFVDGLVCGGF